MFNIKFEKHQVSLFLIFFFVITAVNIILINNCYGNFKNI